MITYKILRKVQTNNISIININMQNYYSELKTILQKGYKQVVLPSKVLLSILSDLFISKGVRIIEIEFMEVDEPYTNEIDKMISDISFNREKYIYLERELNSLIEEDGIEIKKIKFNLNNNVFSISINGLVKLNEELSPNNLEMLISLIESSFSYERK